jgi:hypothetical protein
MTDGSLRAMTEAVLRVSRSGPSACEFAANLHKASKLGVSLRDFRPVPSSLCRVPESLSLPPELDGEKGPRA